MATDLSALPSTFSWAQARGYGLSDRRLYALRDSGEIDEIGRGLFRRADADPADLDLLEIAHRAPQATLCLTTALARHGLTDAIPSSIDIALPRGQRHPQTRAPVTWHSFAPETFMLGRELIDIGDDLSIGCYNAERSIIDAYRLRHEQGSDLAHEALRRWLRQRGAQPSTLLKLARNFRTAEPALRAALEILT